MTPARDKVHWAAVSLALALCACGGDEGASEPKPSAAHGEQIWVVNTGSMSISVVDHASKAVIDTIAVGEKPHGQAPASTGDRVYVTTDGDRGEVIAVDAGTRKVLWRIEAGERLNEPHLTRDDRFLFAPDLLAGNVVVVDVGAGQVTDEITLTRPGTTELLVALHNTYASHDGLRMYVTAILSQSIAEIDVASHEVLRVIALSGEPRPAVITSDDRKMYVQLSLLHGFVELDLETGTETRKIEWPDPGTRPPGYDLGELPTLCHGIGITPDESELWAASNVEGNVRVYSLPGLEEQAVIQVGTLPNWIAFSRDGSTAYVTNTDPAAPNGTLSVIDVASREVVATLDVGVAPKRVHRVDAHPQ